MALHVRLGDPALLSALMSELMHNGCVAERLDDSSCLVIHVFSGHDEAVRELEFFVKAWQLAHPGVAAAVSH